MFKNILPAARLGLRNVLLQQEPLTIQSSRVYYSYYVF